MSARRERLEAMRQVRELRSQGRVEEADAVEEKARVRSGAVEGRGTLVDTYA